MAVLIRYADASPHACRPPPTSTWAPTRTPGRSLHARAHHGAISSSPQVRGLPLEPLGAPCMQVLITAPSPPHRYVGSRSLEPTPRALGARARERIELPAIMMDETTLRAKLQPYAERRHLHFGSLRPAGFSVRLSAARRDPFDETIRHLGGGFCCVEAERRGGFGHFWYALLLWGAVHL